MAGACPATGRAAQKSYTTCNRAKLDVWQQTDFFFFTCIRTHPHGKSPFQSHSSSLLAARNLALSLHPDAPGAASTSRGQGWPRPAAGAEGCLLSSSSSHTVLGTAQVFPFSGEPPRVVSVLEERGHWGARCLQGMKPSAFLAVTGCGECQIFHISLDYSGFFAVRGCEECQVFHVSRD